jgi:hypothetical protein
MRKLAGVVAIILLSLGACVQEPNFSSTPVISFKSIQRSQKQVMMVLAARQKSIRSL